MGEISIFLQKGLSLAEDYWKQINEFGNLMDSKVFTCDSDAAIPQYVPTSIPKVKEYNHVDVPHMTYKCLAKNLISKVFTCDLDVTMAQYVPTSAPKVKEYNHVDNPHMTYKCLAKKLESKVNIISTYIFKEDLDVQSCNPVIIFDFILMVKRYIHGFTLIRELGSRTLDLPTTAQFKLPFAACNSTKCVTVSAC